jgi:GxxExxY protein
MNANDSEGAHASGTVDIVEKELSYTIVGVFFKVYNALGFGFLESVYVRALEIFLKRRGLLVERERLLDVHLDGELLGQFRVDLLVEGRIIVEVKSTERLSPVPRRQLQNYLAASNLHLGLLLHFGPQAAYYRVLGRPGSNR